MIETSANEKYEQFFTDLMKRGLLSHAYCLVGTKSSNIREFAFAIATQLLSTASDRLEIHPDFLWVQQEMNEKTGKTKRDIDIEQIKQVRQFSMGRPLQAQHKVVVIDEAEKMNAHSANALLKTLEEPKGHTVLFLLTEDETQLLPTIRSRAQVVYLPSPVPHVFENSLVEQFINLFGEPLYKKLQGVEELFGDKKDSVATRENLQNILDVWEVVNRDYLLLSLGQSDKCVHQIDVSKKYGASVFINIDKKIRQAKKYLEQNIHPRLLIEQILLSIP